jgi:hypothetical protein
VLERETGQISAWAFVVVGVNVAIVYVFAAVTKSEADWASGGVLRQVTASTGWFRYVWSRVLETGLGDDTSWALVARAVALMQVVIAIAYVVVTRADASRARWVRLLAWGALAAAVGFHGSLLLFAINIRWFSYYMIAIAAAFFLPRAVLEWFVGLVASQLRIAAQVGARRRTRRPTGVRNLAVVSSGTCIVALVGFQLDLPGATTAGVIGAVATLAAMALVAARGRDAMHVRHGAIAAAAGALVLSAAVHVWPIRFQYYLYLVADLQRRGEPAEVLAAYEKAEPYAPPGQSRRRQIETLRSRVGTRRDD